MKTLDLRFYSEKQNVTKIDLSDLGDIQISEVDKRTLAKVTFNKKDLVCGEVVKFADGTFGIFVPWEEQDIINKLEKHLTKEEIDVFSAVPTTFKEGIFASYKKDKLRAIQVQLYEDDLTAVFCSDVTRVYRQIVPKKIILSDDYDFFGDFVDFIAGWTSEDVVKPNTGYIFRSSNNQLDVDLFNWDVSKVQDVTDMFKSI